MHKERLAIDMDEVIADTTQKFITVYRERHAFEMTEEMLHGKNVTEVLPDALKPTLKQYINEPGFFRDIPVMADSVKAVKELQDKYDVFIVSAAMEFRNSLIDKFDWLEEHFPFIEWTNIMFCGRKIVDADIMIDDRSRNFSGFRGRKILFSSHHNLTEEIPDAERADNWLHAAEMLLR